MNTREETTGEAGNVQPMGGVYGIAGPTEDLMNGEIKSCSGVVVKGDSSVEPPAVK